jgi:hypothetical protein
MFGSESGLRANTSRAAYAEVFVSGRVAAEGAGAFRPQNDAPQFKAFRPGASAFVNGI